MTITLKLNNATNRKGEKSENEKVIGEKVKDIKKEYLGLICIDPFLPKELLLSNWAFAELTEMLKKLTKS